MNLNIPGLKISNIIEKLPKMTKNVFQIFPGISRISGKGISEFGDDTFGLDAGTSRFGQKTSGLYAGTF